MAAIFYAYDWLIASLCMARLGDSLEVLMGIFDRVGGTTFRRLTEWYANSSRPGAANRRKSTPSG